MDRNAPHSKVQSVVRYWLEQQPVSFLHRTFRNLFIDGIKSLDEFRLYVEIRSSVTVELAREAIHGHSRSSFIVPIDAAYMTSY